MTLEYEKLFPQINSMVTAAVSRQRQLATQQGEISQKLNAHAADRDTINKSLDLALTRTDNKLYAARPHNKYDHELLNAGVDASVVPDTAVIIGADGSQIMPDRHAPFLYSLINIGIIIYYHGVAKAPDTLTKPTLKFPDGELRANETLFTSADVSIARDLAEIATLSQTVCEQSRQTEDLVLGLLDQRLLYRGEAAVLRDWLESLQQVEACYEENGRAYLTGFISNPGTSAVVNMLRALDIDRIDTETGEFLLEPETLIKSNVGLTDADIFGDILQPGQRSTVFINISDLNTQFGKRGQEICFFYLNVANNGRHISRVDFPKWLADDVTAVNRIHALAINQCKFEYPYVLTRADEIAVILSEDRDAFENMIAMRMGPQFALRRHSPKQSGKYDTRSSRTRFQDRKGSK
ncbi:MAG: DNA double-strand break repair nuclease NurA [Chloroflexi bacterium]|nr:DNA double-strand break repair nuclease NurA [Chloroflexota bacterium]